MQQAVIEFGAGDFDAFGQNEAALKLPGGNAAMQIDAFVVFLPATDQELVFFQFDRKVRFGEASDGKRDAQAGLSGSFDVVGWITLGRQFRDAVESLLELLEPEHQRAVEQGKSGHCSGVSSSS